MKKIYYTLLASLILLSGCSLTETPIDQLPEDEAYKTPELVYINAVAGLYKDFRSLGIKDHNFWDMNCVSSDETMLPTRGGDWYDGGLWQAVFAHEWTPSTGMFKNAWNDRYSSIGKCNQSLKTIESEKTKHPTATFYDDYIAEVRAIRAVSYFYLLDSFGRVPIVTSADTPINEVKQAKRSEVFEFVKNELQESLPNLASAHSNTEGKYYGRVTKSVVYFILAKMALNSKVYTDDNWEVNGNNPAGSTDFTVDGNNIGAWNAVIKYCDLLQNEGYSLQPNFSDNFSVSNDRSKENIFTIPMDPALYRSENYNVFQRTLHYIHGSAFGMGTWNGASATLELMQTYGYKTSTEDPRLELCFYTGKVKDMDGNFVKAEDKTTDFEYLPLEIKLQLGGSEREKRAGARWKKYEIDTHFQGSGEFFHNDHVLFRYADALLMKAEAEFRLGNTANALTIVNDVRNRVGALPRTALTEVEILEERMLELSWEGWRRNDMIRFGTFTKAIADRPQSEPYKIVFPIHQDVLSSNLNLTQNPKYTK